MPIPSPYNFVPVASRVFLPDWAAQVSQDVPFSDGISGWFEIEVEATTPIYVRNGGDLPERNPDNPQHWLKDREVQSFFKLPNGSFAIPGSSIKGVIRSVLEIASFGKFSPVDPKRYGVHGRTPAELARAQQPDSVRQDALDLAETIFGAADVQHPMKGRFHFETLLAAEETAHAAQEAPVVTVLSSPKPTYYPNYLEQDVSPETGQISTQYRTYMTPAAKLRGWKRYVSRKDEHQPDPSKPPRGNDGMANLKVATSFVPLVKGARFKGRVHFHNLQPKELGAVLWTLSWGNNSQLRHRLGMGKPYGYGHVRITFPASQEKTPALKIISCGPETCAKTEDDNSWMELRSQCVKAFTDQMEGWCKENGLGSWRDTPQVRALLRLATPSDDQDWPHPLHYPPAPAAFANYKAKRLALPLPPPPLPDFTGQQRTVAFQREQRTPKSSRELWFTLKDTAGNDEPRRFKAVLRNPRNLSVAGELRPGHQAKLWVTGIENGTHFILSEEPPSTTP